MKTQELSLLFIFDAIMTEHSITRAADRLAMTQPAVSNAVAKMRHHWKDPLFIKKGRSIEPTSFALNLWQQIHGPIYELSGAVDARHFDPLESKRKFRVSSSDIMIDLIWAPLARELQEEAPHVDVHAVPYTIDGAIDQLREAKVDITFGVISDHDSSVRSSWLFDSAFTCAMRKDHELAKNPLTLENFLTANHLLVSLSGDASGFVDQTLSKHGLSRRIAMTVNHFASVPNILAQTDLIAVVPRTTVGDPKHRDTLFLVDPPIELETTSIYMAWHARHDKDPGMIWMREKLALLAQREWNKCDHCSAAAEQAVSSETI